jgi:hypothetical protein
MALTTSRLMLSATAGLALRELGHVARGGVPIYCRRILIVGTTLSKADKNKLGDPAQPLGYPGPERRHSHLGAKLKPRARITFDAKGNPVWEAAIDTPLRRESDNTIDLLKCLDVEDLSLADDGLEDDVGYDPYRRS